MLHHVEVLVSKSHDASFPSDHSIVAGSATAGLWIVAHYGVQANRAVPIVATALALVVAFSRVYVGAHYPGDVVAGLGVGATITLAVRSSTALLAGRCRGWTGWPQTADHRPIRRFGIASRTPERSSVRNDIGHSEIGSSRSAPGSQQ